MAKINKQILGTFPINKPKEEIKPCAVKKSWWQKLKEKLGIK